MTTIHAMVDATANRLDRTKAVTAVITYDHDGNVYAAQFVADTCDITLKAGWSAHPIDADGAHLLLYTTPDTVISDITITQSEQWREPAGWLPYRAFEGHLDGSAAKDVSPPF